MSEQTESATVGIFQPGKMPAERSFYELPPLSLYVHLPWCIAKCPYCDFNSHEYRDKTLPEQLYVDALLADLTTELPEVWGRQIHSVFLGGGTTSLFSPEAIDRLLAGIRALIPLRPGTEITMEANPGTFEQQKFSEFRSAGINRLSLGIQSFNTDHLKALGRIHDHKESLNAAHQARDAGFDNINLDLMFGLPAQSVDQALEDLSTAIDAGPEHISYYQLTLEPNTLFHTFPPKLPREDTIWQMQTQAIEKLQDSGFNRYEVSAWSKPGCNSVHNSNYWLFGDYLGIGAGAHGKISRADTNKITRRAKQKHPQRYLDTAGSEQNIITQQDVPLNETALEFNMNALRLAEGYSPQIFRAHTGVDLQHWHAAFQSAEDKGLLEYSALNIKPTEQGFNFLNELLQEFMPQQEN